MRRMHAVATRPAPAPGIGIPLNQPAGRSSVCRLNRARRIAPQRMNRPTEASNIQKAGANSGIPSDSRPICITSIPGATPKATRSAIESNSAPKSEVALSKRAARPSMTSSNPHHTIIQPASSRLPSWPLTIDPVPISKFAAVKLFGIVYRSLFPPLTPVCFCYYPQAAFCIGSNFIASAYSPAQPKYFHASYFGKVFPY